MPSLVIDFSIPVAEDLAWSFGRKLGLAQDATAAQVKAEVIAYMRAVYQDQKRLERAALNLPAELDLS